MSPSSFFSKLTKQPKAMEKSPQLKSPLFVTLPAELRAIIWEYVLVREETENDLWDEGKLYYRPDYRGPKHLTIGLLQTCRRIHEETQPAMLKLFQNMDHTFWFNEEPKRSPWPADKEYFRKLPQELQREVGHVHIYSQLYLVEDRSISDFFSGPEFLPKKLTLTIRHTDWWGNESNQQLHFRQQWYTRLIPPASVNTLVIEFETLDNERKLAELDRVVDVFRRWTFARTDNVKMVIDGSMANDAAARGTTDRSRETVWRWTRKQSGRVSRVPMEGIRRPFPRAVGGRPISHDQHYYVVALTFRPQVSEEP